MKKITFPFLTTAKRILKIFFFFFTSKGQKQEGDRRYKDVALCWPAKLVDYEDLAAPTRNCCHLLPAV